MSCPDEGHPHCDLHLRQSSCNSRFLLHADAAARSRPDPGKLPTYDPADMVYEPDTEQIPAYEPPSQVSSAFTMPLTMSGCTQVLPLFCGSQAIQDTGDVHLV